MSQAHYLRLVGIKMEKPFIGPLNQNINIHLEIGAVRVRFNDVPDLGVICKHSHATCNPVW